MVVSVPLITHVVSVGWAIWARDTDLASGDSLIKLLTAVSVVVAVVFPAAMVTVVTPVGYLKAALVGRVTTTSSFHSVSSVAVRVDALTREGLVRARSQMVDGLTLRVTVGRWSSSSSSAVLQRGILVSRAEMPRILAGPS